MKRIRELAFAQVTETRQPSPGLPRTPTSPVCSQRPSISMHRSQQGRIVQRIGSEVPFLVGHPGLEPGANGLRIHCSTT